MRLGRCLLIAVAAVLVPFAASAQSSLDELKFGVFDHDAKFAGGKEGGADINGEVLFRSPVPDAAAAQVPAWLRWAAQPRLHAGFEANTSGFTNQGYFGLTWTWLLTDAVLYPGDGIDFGYSFGPSFNDGHIRSSKPDEKSLGSHVLFRESFELGYRFMPGYELSAFFDHVSNGGLAKQNQSINDAGFRLGVKF